MKFGQPTTPKDQKVLLFSLRGAFRFWVWCRCKMAKIVLPFVFLKIDRRDAQVSAKSPIDSWNLYRCRSRGAIKTNGFRPRGPARKFTFSREGCRKLQNLERHAGPEAKQNALLASTGIEILWFATPSEREREFRTCLKICEINRRFL